MHLLGLLGGGDLSCTNRPDGLVRNHNPAPVLGLVCNCLELVGDDLDRLVGLTLLEGFTAAQNDAEACVEGRLGLAGDELYILD